MHNWRWSEVDQFPPIQYVLTAAIYGDEYKALIERMKKPVPQPTITESAEKSYLTLDTATAEVTSEEVSSEKYDPFHIPPLGKMFVWY